MNILIDQEYIPSYSNDFFNKIVDSTLVNKLIVLYNGEFGNDIRSKFESKKVKRFIFFGILFKPFRLFYIMKYKPSLVVFSANQRDIFLPLSILILRLFGIKVFVWGMFHKIGGQSIYCNFFYLIISLLSNKSLTYSKYGAIVLNSLLVPKRKVRIIGTGLSIFHNYSIEELKKPIKNQTINFLCVMRLSYIKNPFFILKFCEKLNSLGLDFKITCIGGGEAYDKLVHLVRLNRLETKLVFLPPIYCQTELESYFINSHFSLLPSCPGLSIHHSFSYGLPVISDNLIYENSSESLLLIDEVNSLIFDYNDLDSFFIKFLSYINDNKYLSICEGALNTINSNNINSKVNSFIRAIND